LGWQVQVLLAVVVDEVVIVVAVAGKLSHVACPEVFGVCLFLSSETYGLVYKSSCNVATSHFYPSLIFVGK
jgi:hypothetical protein